MRRLVLATVFAVVSFLGSHPARAQAVEFGRPSYDLVAVASSVFFPEANLGGANEGTCLVLNTSPAPLRVRMDVEIVYADGHADRLSRIQDPGVLDVEGGFELSVFFVIPPDAPLGPAQFSCSVRAQSMVSRAQQEGEISVASFEIVAP